MFYITTPIYYVNDEPHLGHAYSTVLADVLARYHRLQGEPSFFLTGVDEHGQKVFNAVRKNQVSDPQAYVDQMAERFQNVWHRLEISYDDFIRTTEPRHKLVVQHVLQQLWEDGEIYRGEYEGWYCVPDERFWTEKDLRVSAEGVSLCPDCGRAVERIIEANYFFRMSRYQDWLVQYIEEHPDFIQPTYRKNEVLGFLRQPLSDLCISRPALRMGWGIPLPFDLDYVTYVWFDALLNYVTAAGFLEEPERFNTQWPNAVHLIGKDILTTHSVYWPTMLKAAGLPLPKTIFAHGWWSVDGLKMGKSLGNAVRPLDLVDTYGSEAFRFFLMREMTPGQDSDFDAERIKIRYSTDLANNLGNLLQRVTTMAVRYLGGWLDGAESSLEVQYRTAGNAESNLREQVEELPDAVFTLVDRFAINAALGKMLDALAEINGYLERCAPWVKAKSGDLERVGVILYTAAEALRLVSVLLSPILPEKSAEIWRRLGWTPLPDLADGLRWGCLKPGIPVTVGAPLFPRID
jgi:methionyl-tRNA synthetase